MEEEQEEGGVEVLHQDWVWPVRLDMTRCSVVGGSHCMQSSSTAVQLRPPTKSCQATLETSQVAGTEPSCHHRCGLMAAWRHQMLGKWGVAQWLSGARHHQRHHTMACALHTSLVPSYDRRINWHVFRGYTHHHHRNLASGCFFRLTTH